MTTNVDILFKELPAPSRADDRISRPDVPSSTADSGREPTALSENDSNQPSGKTFADHLNEHETVKQPASDNHSANSTPSNDRNETVPFDTPVEMSATEESQSSGSVDAISPNAQSLAAKIDSDEAPNPMLVADPNNLSHQAGLDIISKESLFEAKLPQSVAQKSHENSALNHVKSQTKTVPVKVVQNSASTAAPSIEGQTETQNQLAEAITAAIHGKPMNTVAPEQPLAKSTDDSYLQNAANPGTPTKREALVATQPVLENIVASSSGEASIAEKPAINVPLSAVTDELPVAAAAPGSIANSGGMAENVSDVKKANILSATNQAETEQPSNQNAANKEIGTAISAMAKAMRDQIANADLMEKQAAPPDVTATESMKVIPLAPVQSAISVPKLSNSNKKPDGNNIAVNSVKSANGTAGSKAAQSAIQNAATNSTLNSAQSSDILLEPSLAGQKSEPAPLQPLSLNGQSSLSSGVALSAQEMNIQKTGSSLAGVFKTDAPGTTKLINEQITVAINRNLAGGQSNFSIRLHPAELGQVDIRIEFLTDGKMQAAMMVESEKTLTLLQRDQAALEKALQDAGINLSNKNLSFSLMKQGQENNGQKFAEATGDTSGEDAEQEMLPAAAMQYMKLGYSDQALDISV